VQERKKDEHFIIGNSKRKYLFRSCCNPIPGDPIVGILSPDGIVSVHKKSCPVAENIASKHGDWVVIPEWGKSYEKDSFLARITFRGLDRIGLLNDITSYISKEKGLNMKRINLNVDEGIFQGYIDLNVSDKYALGQILLRLRSLNGLTNVERAEI
jgi:GTP pyrophosphokinase